MSATNERRGNLEALKAKDEKSAADIEMQMRKLQRIADQIALLKMKMASVLKEYDDKNTHLREEKDRLVYQFQLMKSRMNQLRENQREKLTNMSLESNHSLQKVRINFVCFDYILPCNLSIFS